MFRRILKFRKKNSRKRSQKGKAFFYVLLNFFILLTFPLTLFFLLPRLIIIREVACESQFGGCSTLITQGLDSAKDLSFYDAKLKLTSILTQEILVKDFYIRYQAFDKISVSVLERKPKYALLDSVNKTVYLVDKDGKVLGTSDTSNLPKLIFDRSYKEGENVEDETRFSLDLIYELSSLYVYNEARLTNDGIAVKLVDGPNVILPTSGDKEILLGSLNMILRRLNREGQDSRIENSVGVKEIDLRFKNPILRF